jgi:hypothetical protein
MSVETTNPKDSDILRAISVDDVQAGCNRFEEIKVTFKKKPSEGAMKNIAFLFDPDGTHLLKITNVGYWIEVVPIKEAKVRLVNTFYYLSSVRQSHSSEA